MAKFVEEDEPVQTGQAKQEPTQQEGEQPESWFAKNWIKIALVGGGVGAAMIWANNSSKDESLSDTEKEWVEKIINDDMDFSDEIIDDDYPMSIVISPNDEGVDYQKCLTMAQDLRQNLENYTTSAVPDLLSMPDESIAHLIYISSAYGSQVTASFLDLYVKLVNIWLVLSKPMTDGAADMMKAAQKHLMEAVDISTKPSEIIMLKNVTESTTLQGKISLDISDKTSAGGLVNVANVQVLGGKVNHHDVEVEGWSSREEYQKITWMPYVAKTDVDVNVYGTVLSEVQTLYSTGAAMLKASFAMAPSLSGMLDEMMMSLEQRDE